MKLSKNIPILKNIKKNYPAKFPQKQNNQIPNCKHNGESSLAPKQRKYEP